MTTTTTITEDVLLANPEFVAWCDTWQEQGRCPLVMADWMLDTYKDERMYRAARWAWAKEERMGKFAIPISHTGYVFLVDSIEDYPGLAEESPDDLPVRHHRSFKYFPAAIAFYFVHFDLELANKYSPKDEVWT